MVSAGLSRKFFDNKQYIIVKGLMLPSLHICYCSVRLKKCGDVITEPLERRMSLAMNERAIT